MAKKINGSSLTQLELPFGGIKGINQKVGSKDNVVFFDREAKKMNDAKELKKRQENIDKLISLAQSLNWRQWGE